MVSLRYKGRIHKAKFSARGLRYILSDQAARAFPALQRRWLLPVELCPIDEAAGEDLAIPSAGIKAPPPQYFADLGIALHEPLQLLQHFYSLNDTVVTGWAGAMMKDGFLLAAGPANWTALVRARRHRLRVLPRTRPYYNLMAPIPARGHIFHWLFDSAVPLLTFLESGGRALGLGVIVNARRSEFQQITVDYLGAQYGIDALEPIGESEAVYVPHLRASIQESPRALQSPMGMAALDDFGRFIVKDLQEGGSPRRMYISRNDARLRRVRNEDRILALLQARGFECVTLKGLPIARQVQLFRQAEAVVAPHGAGLAHTAWCKPGTRIIEFFPSPAGPRGNPRNASANMWLIAMQRGLRYSSYLAGPPESRTDKFAIPEDLLLHALEAAAI